MTAAQNTRLLRCLHRVTVIVSTSMANTLEGIWFCAGWGHCICHLYYFTVGVGGWFRIFALWLPRVGLLLLERKDCGERRSPWGFRDSFRPSACAAGLCITGIVALSFAYWSLYLHFGQEVCTNCEYHTRWRWRDHLHRRSFRGLLLEGTGWTHSPRNARVLGKGLTGDQIRARL